MDDTTCVKKLADSDFLVKIGEFLSVDVEETEQVEYIRDNPKTLILHLKDGRKMLVFVMQMAR